MPKLSAQEKLEKKQLLEEKREARRIAKEEKEKRNPKGSQTGSSKDNKDNETGESSTTVDPTKCYISEISDDSLNHIMWFMSARDLGTFAMTCRHFRNKFLVDGRVSFLLSRLSRPNDARMKNGFLGGINLCPGGEIEATEILKQSFEGGDTGRIQKSIFRKDPPPGDVTGDFATYARFVEEAVCGYATQNDGRKGGNNGTRTPILLPPFVNGRFVSASPEHSVARMGGGNESGGGSGVVCWGVGKRGQLGTGKQMDEEEPKFLLGGIGYGIRIVQVSAGGGLVRIAHTLLLTSTGQVLSFGTGQYGALGHGYSGGKQLPDVLRPKFIDALLGTRMVCVSAGEIHSAAVSADGDVYTWGDGFCGQLGHGGKKPEVSPLQVEKGGLEDESISHVSCGARHTLAVTEDGEVFSWGLGHYGVLGRTYTPFDHDSAAALVGLGVEEREDHGMAANLDDDPQGGGGENGGHGPQVQGMPYDFENLMAHLDMLSTLSLVDSSDQCIPKRIDSLEGIKIIGASAGHRHSLFLDEKGTLYSCGAGVTGCLGHGDNLSSSYPMKIKSFDDDDVKIMQMSAGVDMSMAVSTTGIVYAWGKTEGGRLGLGMQNARVTLPRQVRLTSEDGRTPLKAVDVECGYVHSLIVGVNGTIHQCGMVGVDGAADGLQQQQQRGGASGSSSNGEPILLDGYNIWHRIAEPKEQKVKQERWKKLGKYEVKGRQRMMEE